MNKPLILIEHEMREELTELVNTYTSQLPITMIVSALGDIHRTCVGIADNQIVQARQQYEQSLMQETKEEVAQEEENELCKDSN